MKQLLKKCKDKKPLDFPYFFCASLAWELSKAPQMFSEIMCIVLASVGIIGAVKVYKKWKSGASDFQPATITWFGSFQCYQW